MKFKKRLLISFLIIIFLPVLLSGALLYGISILQHQGSVGSYSALTDSIQLMSHYSTNEYETLTSQVSKDPDKILDSAYMEEINRQLRKKFSYLVIRAESDGLAVFDGTPAESDVHWGDLPGYGEGGKTANSFVYLEGKEPTLLRQIDFTTKDGESYSAFLITTASSTLPEVKALIVNFFLYVMAILLITALALVTWIYRGMMPQLKALTKAAEDIKEGNLDQPIKLDEKQDAGDEFTELSNAFEEMRLRLKETANEKLQTETEQKQLISNIAHDLKTPITAVKGYAEGLLDGIATTPEKQEAYIRTIYNKANEMNTLINELTTYSKIDTNRIPYNFKNISVKDYFADCAEELAMDLENQQITMNYSNQVDDNVRIIADPEQLARVIHNIIGNSVKYMGHTGGNINMRVKDVGDFVQIELEDNGRGIETKDLPYIFDRMYRADASRNSGTGGSGIGLSVVKKIMEDHGGKVWATSKVGEGTVMYLVLRKYQEEI